jgi:hypothetical protein
MAPQKAYRLPSGWRHSASVTATGSPGLIGGMPCPDGCCDGGRLSVAICAVLRDDEGLS